MKLESFDGYTKNELEYRKLDMKNKNNNTMNAPNWF